MLTKAQIQGMAQRNGIGMQVQERDYLQHLLPQFVPYETVHQGVIERLSN
jgi:hypothetical protein